MRAAMLRQPAHLVSGWIAGGCGLACRTAPEKLRAPPPSSTLCPRRKAGRGTDGEGLERHSLHWPRRTSVRGTLNGSALRPDAAALATGTSRVRSKRYCGFWTRCARSLEIRFSPVVVHRVVGGVDVRKNSFGDRKASRRRSTPSIASVSATVFLYRSASPGHAQLKPLQGGLASGWPRSRSEPDSPRSGRRPQAPAGCRPEARRGR